MTTATQIENFTEIDHEEGDPCPVHGTSHRKIYTFGSTMSGETEVCTFSGCGCAVSVKHDPCGFGASVMYHDNYNAASGRGRLHAMDCAAKYR